MRLNVSLHMSLYVAVHMCSAYTESRHPTILSLSNERKYMTLLSRGKSEGLRLQPGTDKKTAPLDFGQGALAHGSHVLTEVQEGAVRQCSVRGLLATLGEHNTVL